MKLDFNSEQSLTRINGDPLKILDGLFPREREKGERGSFDSSRV